MTVGFGTKAPSTLATVASTESITGEEVVITDIFGTIVGLTLVPNGGPAIKGGNGPIALLEKGRGPENGPEK